jgi:hypothetical protein
MASRHLPVWSTSLLVHASVLSIMLLLAACINSTTPRKRNHQGTFGPSLRGNRQPKILSKRYERHEV